MTTGESARRAGSTLTNRYESRLAAVVAAWPNLPEAIRAGILAREKAVGP
jgi:hypothetical protein